MAQNTQTFPPIPPSLKSLNTFMKIATDFETTEPVITYWCRFFVVQNGLKIDSKSKEAVVFLTSVMGWLEKEKKARHDNEAITNEMVGQAHVENYAYKMFNKADNDDREGTVTKNTPRLFLIASNLFEVISVFGDLSEEVEKRLKYGKWKAIYISRCLKNGETPVPGPVAGTDAEEFNFDLPNVPMDSHNTENTNTDYQSPGVQPNEMPYPNIYSGPTEPMESSSGRKPESTVTAMNGLSLAAEDIVKAQKYCKFAGSALQYEDIPTAISNLQKALSLLTTGKE